MYIEVTREMFINEFKAIRPDNFSHEGLNELFNYFEQLEDDCDMRIELDVIAICCEWREDSLQDILDNYQLESLEELQENTHVIELDNTILYKEF